MNIVDKLLKDTLSYYQDEKIYCERQILPLETKLEEIKKSIVKIDEQLAEIQKEINARQNQTIL